jgi:hypothetical protein
MTTGNAASGNAASASADDAADRPDSAVMAQMQLTKTLIGPWIAQACYSICELGVPDLLAEGPRTVAELAAKCGADRTALQRILAALAAADLLRETAPGTFGNTPASELLMSGTPVSRRANVLLNGQEVFRSFGEIMHTVRTGKPAFDHVHGTPFYTYLDAHPEIDKAFGFAQGNLGVPAALDTCDLSGVGTVADLGGGNGRLLGHLLTAHPALRGVLVERAEMIAQASEYLAGLGVLDRTELVEGSFFDTAPAGADAYILSRCLHNWDDDGAAAILRTVRAAAAPAARLFVFEEFLTEEQAAGSGAAVNFARMIDLLMLVMLEGHDRSERDYRELLTAAGFEILATRPAPAGSKEGVIEARPS